MKWKIENGIIECEGTPIELFEMMDKMNKPVVINEQVEKKPLMRRKREKDYTADEDEVFLECNGNVRLIHERLPHRSMTSIYFHKKNMNKNFPNGYITLTKSRMLWVHDRAKYYVNTYNWDYEKATNQARIDYKNKLNNRPIGIGMVIKDTKVPPITLEKQPEPIIKYKVIKWNKDEGTMTTINIYNDKHEAEKDKDELNIGSKTIGENAEYLVIQTT